MTAIVICGIVAVAIVMAFAAAGISLDQMAIADRRDQER